MSKYCGNATTEEIRLRPAERTDVFIVDGLSRYAATILSGVYREALIYVPPSQYICVSVNILF
jgi:hypothetical protein